MAGKSNRPEPSISRRLGDGTRSNYTPYILGRDYTEQQLRDEYRRMRRALQQRVRRVAASGEFPENSAARTLSRFPAPSSIETKGQIALKLSDLESVLSRGATTLTGLREMREETLKTLRDRGYTNINRENIGDFTRFMESTRSLALSILRYSYDRYGRAQGADRNKRLELFNLAQSKGITTASLIRDFRYYTNHMDELQQLPDRPTGRRLGIKSIRKLLS